VPYEEREEDEKTDSFNRPISKACKKDVAKNVQTKKELAEARDELEKLKAKVAL
jgi:hypothetical protein